MVIKWHIGKYKYLLMDIFIKTQKNLIYTCLQFSCTLAIPTIIYLNRYLFWPTKFFFICFVDFFTFVLPQKKKPKTSKLLAVLDSLVNQRRGYSLLLSISKALGNNTVLQLCTRQKESYKNKRDSNWFEPLESWLKTFQTRSPFNHFNSKHLRDSA